MALFNHATKELTAKIVYYGPGLCGKTSNLKLLHQRLERGAGKLLSLSTAQDRTIYFDLLPIELGNIKGYTVRFQVCTVPGQVFYNETRKIVLRGVDGLVFVVDSQWSMLSHNLECFQNLKENLHEEKISLESLPVVIQYNKRDLPSALSVEALQDSLGFHSYPYVETVASEGSGVIETFKLVSKLTFVDLLRRLQRGWQSSAETPAVRPAEAFTAFSGGTPAAATDDSAAAAIPEVAPVLAVAESAGASDRGEAPPEEPLEEPLEQPREEPLEQPPEEDGEAWVVPSAEGAFPELSEDANPSSTPPAAEARSTVEAPSAAAPAAPETSILAPAVLLAALAVPPPAPAAPEPPPSPPPPPITHVTPPLGRASTVDQKLNAVLAEARRAAGRVSGSYRRLDGPEVNTQEIPTREVAERRLEEAVSALRAELSGELARLRDEVAAARGVASKAESAAAAANDRARRLEDALRQAFHGLSD
ncbi:MAG TPA: GTPase domain-containing protein [Thermoanaerobaculia bacterium]